MKISAMILAGVFLILPLSLYAADEHPGKELHDEGCLTCHKGDHDATFYNRKNRKMDSYKGLQSMVRMCDARMGTKLFDEDMEDIGNYLNDTYYKFPKE